MKRCAGLIALLLCVVLCGSALAVEYVPYAVVDTGSLAADSGTVEAYVNAEDVTESEMTFTVYARDYFDIMQPGRDGELAMGDIIIAGGVAHTVETLDSDEDAWYYVNGGDYDGGLTLCPEGGMYTTTGMDDMYTMTEQGTVTLPIAETVTVTRFATDAEGGPAVGFVMENIAGSELRAAIADMAGEWGELYPGEFSVTVTDGQVSMVMLIYVP